MHGSNIDLRAARQLFFNRIPARFQTSSDDGQTAFYCPADRFNTADMDTADRPPARNSSSSGHPLPSNTYSFLHPFIILKRYGPGEKKWAEAIRRGMTDQYGPR